MNEASLTFSSSSSSSSSSSIFCPTLYPIQPFTPEALGTPSGLILFIPTCEGVSPTTSAMNEPGSCQCEDLCTPPRPLLLLLLLPLFLAFLVPYGPESAPFTPSPCCAPSPAVALPGGGGRGVHSQILWPYCGAALQLEKSLVSGRRTRWGGDQEALCSGGLGGGGGGGECVCGAGLVWN